MRFHVYKFLIFLKKMFLVFSIVVFSVMEAQEFEWESQLRFYWVKDSDNLLVYQCTGESVS